MTTVLCAPVDADLARGVRVSALRGRLHALAREPAAPDAAVTTCLVWVAGVLVEIAGDVADPRSAGALVHEASAVLASVPAVPHDGTARGAPPHEPLTGRQLAVLRQLQEEVPLRQIADGMYVSYNTVKSHARAVYRKLGARSRAEAVNRARELGLV
ncbi:helix-turn-helix transcriptional regulator [Streptomyces longispororuber]|uniref:helix-turn-helix transcriptional regulator n=1 Tax=Streptomyces longispororuber TaxID=68230 RepID=UPI00210EC5F2|nr:LuxR C-terminal-related transcriptional regulator [Streptomyces longispororuber]MCQ4206022.1 LuxR C-terminal-related transcriptional regulator [Streptomyces longispororuber]